MENKQGNILGTQPIGQLLLKFAVPSIIAMQVSALYNIVDQIFIGHSVGVLGNAATNVAFPLSTVCVALCLLFGVGGAANFNLCMGAGDKERARHFVGNAVALLLLSGILLSLFSFILLEPMMRFFGATPDVLGYALEYTGITLWGFPFLIIANGGANLVRADGSPKYSMMCMLVGAIINTVLDPLFIFGFDMGMKGAAWATVIGQVVSGLMVIVYLIHMKTVKLSLSDLKLSGKRVVQITSLGLAGCFNQLAMMVVQITMNNTLTYYGGKSAYGSEIPLACAGIIAKVNMIYFSIIIGISQGLQPIVSFNYGARKYGRVHDTYRLALISATVVSTLAFLCFQLFPRQITSLFGQGSEEYFRFAENYFRTFLFFTFLNEIQPITSNFFTAIGKATRGAVLALTRQIIFLLPLILILPMLIGIDGVMYAGPVADFAAAVLAFVMGFISLKQLRKMEAETNLLEE